MEKLKQEAVEQYRVRECSQVNVRWTVRWAGGILNILFHRRYTVPHYLSCHATLMADDQLKIC